MSDTLRDFFQTHLNKQITHDGKTYKLETVHDDYITLNQPQPEPNAARRYLHVPFNGISTIQVNSPATPGSNPSISIHTKIATP